MEENPILLPDAAELFSVDETGIGSENFYTKQDSLGDILNDTVTSIRDGKATDRDYARLIEVWWNSPMLQAFRAIVNM